jgi:glycine/D-amino acid oxidase-like deaminating enzyme
MRPGQYRHGAGQGRADGGATILEGVKVTGVTDDGARATGVNWDNGSEQGHIAADVVINCGGMWGRDLAAQSGVTCRCMPASISTLSPNPSRGLGICRFCGCRTNAPITNPMRAR